jgi:tetratricopeptide (TPR) repeat protein
MDPGDEEVLCIKGNILSNLGKYEEAIEAFSNFLNIKPASLKVQKNRTYALVKLGTDYLNSSEYESAFKIYGELLNSKDLSSQQDMFLILSESIIDLINSEKYADVKTIYEGILRIRLGESEKDILINETLSNLPKFLTTCETSKKYNEIIMMYDTLMKINPDNIDILKRIGDSLLHSKFYHKALEVYEKVTTLDSHDIDIWCTQGDILSELKMYDEALKVCEKALKFNSGNFRLLCMKGDSLLELNKYFEALKAYEKALEMNPDWPAIWRKKGNVFSKLGFYDEAREAYSKLEELNNRKESGKSKEWYDEDNPINRYHLYK